MPCTEISAEWGAQRIKGLSLTQRRAARAAQLGQRARPRRAEGRGDEPHRALPLSEARPGPDVGGGRAAGRASAAARSACGTAVVGASRTDGAASPRVDVRDARTGATSTLSRATTSSRRCRCKDLVAGLRSAGARGGARASPTRLPYRDFITVGLLLAGCDPQRGRGGRRRRLLPDNWIYIQEPDVRVGRLQIFNNWSPRPGAPTRPRSGSASSTSATRATTCGACRTTSMRALAQARAGADRHHRSRPTSSTASVIRVPEDLPGLLRHLRRSSTSVRDCARRDSRTSSWSAATACTATTTRTTRC